MVSYDRFKYALSNLDGRQWRLFEILANTFLSEEFPNLRPLAGAAGDDGMDASLFQATDDPATVLQYSVRRDWSNKIIETCDRLQETQPDTNVLVYATNQEIGAGGNTLKKSIRSKYRIFLDIRDREWFLTQRNASAKVTEEAEEFCEKVADPQLFGKSSIDRQAKALSDLEAKAAFVYLGLQWADDMREKGLTKLCFEALVRSVLRETTSEERLGRSQIREQIAKLLPAHHRGTLDVQVDGALARLSKVYIRHWKKPDEFCLTWQERVRLAERLAQVASLDDALTAELKRTINVTASEMGIDESTLPRQTVDITRKVVEKVLLDRGEFFASAVTRENAGSFVSFEDIEAVVFQEIAQNRVARGLDPRLLVASVQSIFLNSTEEVRKCLRSLADTYTLFAFMRETPDVQSAVVKIFSDGDIWLDTNVVLPLLAETLIDEPARSHTFLIRAAVECGLRLFVTDGVLEEVATHINRCRSYAWSLGQEGAKGSPPFLLNAYSLSGRDMGGFLQWLENFAGTRRLEDDVADYLLDEHHIDVQDLSAEADRAEQELRAAVGELWHQVREARDKRNEKLGVPPMDPVTRSKLVAHDVTNYVGVIVRRQDRNERRGAFGYRSWWLTLDRSALRMHNDLKAYLRDRPPASPAISPDFMLHYLAVGPVRARISRRTEETLPLMMNMSVLDAVPRDLLDLADSLRIELAGLPPNVISRKIRDTLDEARFILGPNAIGGDAKLTDEVKARLISQAKGR
ncbi:hypothetical protein RB614_12390 [Phytohabitans sp. ZYX-F-186]|uniref:Uncharacterized protein n=1 Tax=Phytohabitans maris TaxID=3071409 RepID=A0ABU0ZE62_9ACTN|nr:hypothetical protein [Phytohabitans sp. ZYX-F-186]MDQ7905323.1 hypothetical protein [Phytohabitans sp. ZYX-F-186]